MNKRRERNKTPQNQPDSLQLSASVSRTEKEDTNLIELGKYFYTLSHLVFGGVVLVILLDFSDRKLLTLVYGTLAVVAFATMGWYFVRRVILNN